MITHHVWHPQAAADRFARNLTVKFTRVDQPGESVVSIEGGAEHRFVNLEDATWQGVFALDDDDDDPGPLPAKILDRKESYERWSKKFQKEEK